jgi:hypothetical protein
MLVSIADDSPETPSVFNGALASFPLTTTGSAGWSVAEN